ncbi:MAG: formaldehyde-activating enzyme [Gemmataceae bacterium]
MAKKKPAPKRKPGKILLRTGEALVEAEFPWAAAEPEVVLGELDGPVGYAIAKLIGDQVAGHSRVFALMDCGLQVKPVTVMVSKVTVTKTKYTNILMGTVQAAIANGVLDAVRSGAIPKAKADDLGIIVSVWLDPAVLTEQVDHRVLMQTHRQATRQAIEKAMRGEPTIEHLLKNQDKITHCFYDLSLKGEL